jgi:hypothetical protein
VEGRRPEPRFWRAATSGRTGRLLQRKMTMIRAHGEPVVPAHSAVSLYAVSDGHAEATERAFAQQAESSRTHALAVS